MNKNYIRGRAFEYEIMKIMKKKGYFCFRSAGSHSPADVVCVNDMQVLLIQAKRSKKVISNKLVLTNYDSDILKLQSLIVCPNVFKQLWIKTDRKGIKKYSVTQNKIELIK